MKVIENWVYVASRIGSNQFNVLTKKREKTWNKEKQV